MHPSGSQVHYLDQEFLRRKMAGVLHVTSRSATALPAADPAPFTSDPFLVVSVGDGSSYTTRTILNNLNPAWHEDCTLFVRWASCCCGGGGFSLLVQSLPYPVATPFSPRRRRPQGPGAAGAQGAGVGQ